MIEKEYSVLYRAKCSVQVDHLYKLLLTEGLDPEVAQEIKQSIHLLHRSIPCVIEQKIKNGELSIKNEKGESYEYSTGPVQMHRL